MGLMKELNDLNAIYLKMHEQEVSEDQDKGYVVTRADKKGNTKAWQGYKAGVKSKTTGKPLYRAADHLKDEVEDKSPVDHYLDELKKTTLASYAKKATTDLANRSFDAGDSEKRKWEPDEEDDKEDMKQTKRKKNIDRAIDKLAKEDIEIVTKLVESGKFSDAEIAKISNLQEADIADILARLEKKRISKGGDPDDSPLGKKTGRAMKAQQDKARKKAGVE